MSMLTDEKENVEHAAKQQIKDISLANYNDNSIITGILVNLAVQFNSILTEKMEIEGINYFYQRINVRNIIK